ncbi:MAG TPA: DUF721 domain-containing protein [Chitinophagales bacterium]
MRNNQVSLGDAIKEWIKEKRLNEPILEAKIAKAWEKVAGEYNARNTKSIAFKGGRLYITVTNPALKQNLFYSRETIADNLNQEIKTDAIREVIIY